MKKIFFGFLLFILSLSGVYSANIEVWTRADYWIIQNGWIDWGQIKTFEINKGYFNYHYLEINSYNVNWVEESSFEIWRGVGYQVYDTQIRKTIDLNNGYYMIIYTHREGGETNANLYYTVFNANKNWVFWSGEQWEIGQVLIDDIYYVSDDTTFHNRSLHIIEENWGFFIGFGNAGETRQFYDINNKVLVNKTIDLANEELQINNLLSNYFEINFIWGVFVLKDIVNTVEFFGINVGTWIVVKFWQIFSDLTTDTRLFFDNFNLTENSLTMSISYIGDNTYSVSVPLDWGEIETTNIIENEFFAGLSDELFFYDSRLMNEIKSNKNYIWLWVTIINDIKYVTWYDEVAWAWYISDNNEGVVSYPDDGSLYPSDGISVPWGGWSEGDIGSIFDIDRNNDGNISIIESWLALFTIAENIIAKIWDLIALLKNFIETFFNIWDIEGGQGFSFIQSANAFSVTDTIATMGTNAEETGLMKFNKSLFWLLLFIVFLMIVGLFFLN